MKKIISILMISVSFFYTEYAMNTEIVCQRPMTFNELAHAIQVHPRCAFKSEVSSLIVLMTREDINECLNLLNDDLFQLKPAQLPQRVIIFLKFLMYKMWLYSGKYNRSVLIGRLENYYRCLHYGFSKDESDQNELYVQLDKLLWVSPELLPMLYEPVRNLFAALCNRGWELPLITNYQSLTADEFSHYQAHYYVHNLDKANPDCLSFIFGKLLALYNRMGQGSFEASYSDLRSYAWQLLSFYRQLEAKAETRDVSKSLSSRKPIEALINSLSDNELELSLYLLPMYDRSLAQAFLVRLSTMGFDSVPFLEPSQRQSLRSKLACIAQTKKGENNDMVSFYTSMYTRLNQSESDSGSLSNQRKKSLIVLTKKESQVAAHVQKKESTRKRHCVVRTTDNNAEENNTSTLSASGSATLDSQITAPVTDTSLETRLMQENQLLLQQLAQLKSQLAQTETSMNPLKNQNQ